ncbi:ABC transporter ATP-binding protein [Paraburkholderia silvatlantica]|uniref:NitT/TauT family transport system ATP-binding protein n=1 Tax=Paraburkholderia silvatlantica TaxID=321895 RepID=A0ABR6FN17_9BURK|nr:ABC transporter ATP-binding protein [Paraburkholderia silvatlantica]MBB2927959.1 NitT/TauT family transport system ATP-binding protein [Paraburkholderia silvatlantica]PVY27479.1 NitT/TauT family transport system ATP-binding protein [Paraburkholderia silvatlantica]PXW34452.1 NitT/TauT family transport system ATP-binding protein [Paraburkholderia silvatlantica]
MSVSAIATPHEGEIASTHASVTDRLKVHRLSHSFQTVDGVDVPIFERLDFCVRSGEIVSIVGRSGAGKSTLFNLVSGLIKPQSGQISVGIREDGNAGRIAYMLQKDLLMPWRTVLQNAVLGIELYRKVKPADYERARQMLARYGLATVADAYPHSLSGGMRQRVALTRTLLVDPTLVLLDEPFSALDYETRLALEDDVMALREQNGTSVVLVTHDIEEAIAMSDRVILLGGRPARIEDDIDVRLTTHGPRTAVSAREAPEFRTFHSRVWNGLRSHTIQHAGATA